MYMTVGNLSACHPPPKSYLSTGTTVRNYLWCLISFMWYGFYATNGHGNNNIIVYVTKTYWAL